MDTTDTAVGLFRVLETQDPGLAARVVAPDNHNVTADVSPAACRIPGPAGALASSAWLRYAFPDLSFEVVEMLAETDRAWLRLRMRGTHDGPFVRFEGDRVDQVVPPTGRAVDVEQIHLLGLRGGLVVRHEAVRDDLALLGQLGVFPPGPALFRTLAWKANGRAARAAREVSDLAAAAAATALPGGE